MDGIRAIVLKQPGEPVVLEERPLPHPADGQIRIRVEACAVCRTDLHIVDAELPNPKLRLVLGHQIVGVDEASGDRMGVPWLGWTDGTCRFVSASREPL